MQPAAIALFAYNRPDHLRRTVEARAANEFALAMRILHILRLSMDWCHNCSCANVRGLAAKDSRLQRRAYVAVIKQLWPCKISR